MRVVIYCLSFHMLFSVALRAQPQSLEWLDGAKRRIVMLSGRDGSGSPFVAAGTIMGEANGRIYIITANHVLRSDGSPPEDVKVRFRFLPGEEFDGIPLINQDIELDLAVVAVAGSSDRRPVLPSDLVVDARSEGSLRVAEAVHSIGYPLGIEWGVNIGGEPVESVVANRIVFQSTYVEEGHSGGGLFDSCGNLVGMILRKSPTEAAGISGIVERLRGWGFPVIDVRQVGCQGQKVVEPATECALSIESEPSGARIRIDGDTRNTTPASATLAEGRQYSVVLQRDGFLDYKELISCGTGDLFAELERKRGAIRVRYTGDKMMCSLRLHFQVGDKAFTPRSNEVRVTGVELGLREYEVTGEIACPGIGGCAVSGFGEIEVRDGALYDVMWQNTGYALCEVELFEHGR